jgi:hypothetical protein
VAESAEVQAWMDYYNYTNPGGNATTNEIFLGYARASVRQGKKPPALTLTAKDQNYYEDMQSQFRSYGIDDPSGTLAKELFDLLVKGYSGDSLDLKLRDTEAYQKRFAGNKGLRDKGFNTYSPAQYISVEDSMRESMGYYGIPKEMQTKDYLAGIIGNAISAKELTDRVASAAQVVYSSPASVRDEYVRMYGISSGDLIAGFLDPKVAEPIIQKRVATATVGGAAKDQGVKTSLAEQIASATPGITYTQAAQGFAEAQQLGVRGERLSSIYGDQYGIQEATQETFGLAGAAKAETTKKKLASKERAAFSGSSGIRAGSLAQDNKSL